MMEKNLIVAVADNGAIGRGGQMPWHLKADLQYFKRITLGCPVIMGRTTFESIGRPLPGRANIVLTRRQTPIEGVTCVPTMEAAYAAAEPAPRVFVIGGASIYAQMLPYCSKLYLTEVEAEDPEAEVFFPCFNKRNYSRKTIGKNADGDLHYKHVVYTKKSAL